MKNDFSYLWSCIKFHCAQFTILTCSVFLPFHQHVKLSLRDSTLLYSINHITVLYFHADANQNGRTHDKEIGMKYLFIGTWHPAAVLLWIDT